METEDTMDITMASILWLKARAAFHEGGVQFMDNFCDADDELLAAFSEGWSPDPNTFALAYTSYRDTLVKQQDRRPTMIPLNLNDLPTA